MTRQPVRGAVRPLRASLVRPECAAEHVRPLAEAPAAGTRLVPAQRSAAAVGEAYGERSCGLYVYRLRRGAEEHVGVVGEVAVEAFVEGRVRGHEAVQPGRVEALVAHYAAGGPRTELVALLHAADPEVAAATALAQEDAPVLRLTGPDGWEQAVWAVPAGGTAVLAEALGRATHYVADGHHRVSASLRLWEAAGRPVDAGVMCVMYPFGSLRLSAFHRRVVGPVDAGRLWEVLSGGFEVRPVPDHAPVGGTFGLYVDRCWYGVTRTGPRPPGVRGLDVALLDAEVVGPLLGPTGAARVEATADTEDLAGQVEACDRDGGALFVLRPATLDQLVEVADRGEVMPPKTTYFSPKPYAGLFLG